MNDSKLHQEGQQIRNILVPNDSYGTVIEKKSLTCLNGYTTKVKEFSTIELNREIGLRVCDETSILYWAAKK